MEILMELLEQYWGMAVVGGLTVGTIITFIVVTIKQLIQDKLKNKQIDLLTGDIKLIDKAREASLKVQEVISSRNEHLERMQCTTFKIMSYLVAASKLTTEDKIALQDEISRLNLAIPEDVKQVAQTGKDTIK
jgi:hypothetical protein